MTHQVYLEKFTASDFDLLISWVNDEESLVQFAGTIFDFPLNHEQLHEYLNDSKRHAFKILYNHHTIGHCEVYEIDHTTAKLCRIFIGESAYRNMGIGTTTTQILTKWCFENLHAITIELNVYDFNIAAIKCYEKAGFTLYENESKISVIRGKQWISKRMFIQKTN